MGLQANNDHMLTNKQFYSDPVKAEISHLNLTENVEMYLKKNC